MKQYEIFFHSIPNSFPVFVFFFFHSLGKKNLPKSHFSSLECKGWIFLACRAKFFLKQNFKKTSPWYGKKNLRVFSFPMVERTFLRFRLNCSPCFSIVSFYFFKTKNSITISIEIKMLILHLLRQYGFECKRQSWMNFFDERWGTKPSLRSRW